MPIRQPKPGSRTGRAFGRLAGALLLAATLRAGDPPSLTSLVHSRARIIVDNDFGGDPDGLFQLAHHLLSPSVEIRGIIGSHNYPRGFYGAPGSSAYAAKVAGELLSAMGLKEKYAVLRGSEDRLKDIHTPNVSEASKFIVSEAMRADCKTPLYMVCGAGLTDLASAYLTETRIAGHLRLIWIGGPEYDGLSPAPPGRLQVEYNLGIDVHAAQVIFNESKIPIWQVPRDTYRRALVSYAELEEHLRSDGKLGMFLLGQLRALVVRANTPLGEAHALGDSPLVLLTALQSSWDADPSSSRYVTMRAPRISDSGWYLPNPEGRPIRVYTSLDTRLMFGDMFAKFARFNAPSAAAVSIGP